MTVAPTSSPRRPASLPSACPLATHAPQLLVPHLFHKAFISPYQHAPERLDVDDRRAYNFRAFQSSIVQEPTMTPLDRIRDQVTNNTIVLYMKGTPSFPSAAFRRARPRCCKPAA